jgi:hypothetical protein
MSPRVVALALAVVLLGHSAELKANSSNQIAYVSIDTADVTSALGDALPSVLVHGAVPASKELDEIALSVRLETWPEGQRLPLRAALEATSPTSGWTIRFKPQSALPDRWYAIVVPPLKSGFSWTRSPLVDRQADDVTRVRFRPGSDPRLSWVELCRKGDAIRGAAVYSEALPIGTVTMLSGDAQGSSGCQPGPLPVPANASKAPVRFADDRASEGASSSGPAMLPPPAARSAAVEFSCSFSARENLKIAMQAIDSAPRRLDRALSLQWSRMAWLDTDCVVMRPAGDW